MFDIEWTRPALDDLRRIDAWLEDEARGDYAARLLVAIRLRARFLVDFPRGGRPHRGDTRILRVSGTPYLIHYRIVPDLGRVQVLRVYHERENWFIEP